MSTSFPSTSSSHPLGDPRLRSDLARSVRRRLDRTDVDDVVQATLIEALAARALPTAASEVRRFVFAIARQKVADLHRRRGRERRLLGDEPSLDACPTTASDGVVELTTWLEQTLSPSPTDAQTLAWMAREANGETLAEIAEAERVSAPMVRQRVSRLRRHLRAHWTKELALLAALALVALGVLLARRHETASRRPIVPERHDDDLRPPTRTPTLPETTPAEDERLPEPPALLAPTSTPGVERPAPAAHASLSEYTRTTTARDGTRTSETTFEVTLPKLDVRSCATPSSPRGISNLTVTFRPDGSAEHVTVDGGVAVGRAEARCVERLYARVFTRAFVGGPAVGHAFFSLVPEPPPAWLDAEPH